MYTFKSHIFDPKRYNLAYFINRLDNLAHYVLPLLSRAHSFMLQSGDHVEF
jgi:hypothetical protein